MFLSPSGVSHHSDFIGAGCFGLGGVSFYRPQACPTIPTCCSYPLPSWHRNVSIALRRVPPFRHFPQYVVLVARVSFYRPQACPTIPTCLMKSRHTKRIKFLSPSGVSHHSDLFGFTGDCDMTVQFLSPSGVSHHSDCRKGIRMNQIRKSFYRPQACPTIPTFANGRSPVAREAFLSPSGVSHHSDS